MNRRSALTLASVVLFCSCARPSGQHTRERDAVAPAQRAAAAIDAPIWSASTLAPSIEPRSANELGRLLILEYHLFGSTSGRWSVTPGTFRRQLEILYDRGYRPVGIGDVVDKRIDLPAGLSPVVFTFDDSPPSQFRYVERDGRLEIDPTSAVGVWLAFQREHPDWGTKAVFCLLPAATNGHAFFGDKGIEGQKTAWRFPKVRWLAEQGFELCGHTLWHMNLAAQPSEVVQEHIARGLLAIDSAVSGYRVRTLALPLGVWPKDRAVATAGGWRDPTTGRTIRYDFDAVLLVSGGPARSPHDPAFDPHALPRVQVYGSDLERWLDYLDQSGLRYVSDGDPGTVAKPQMVSRAADRGSSGRAR